jgi:hypothetical protein
MGLRDVFVSPQVSGTGEGRLLAAAALPDGRSRGALLLTPAPAAERPQEFVLSNR